MQWAIVVSLTLHISAVILIIYFSAFSSVDTQSSGLVLQSIELSPSISSPVQPLTLPPKHHQEMKTPSASLDQVAENPTPESPAEPQSPAAEKSGISGGLKSTPLGLGMTHGYFSPLGSGKTLRDDVRAYYFEIVEKINREWWDKAALLKEPLHEDGVFELVIQRNGTIEELRRVRGTGSREADQLIAEIIKATSPLPPLPSTYELDQFQAPLKIKAPLSLFRF